MYSRLLAVTRSIARLRRNLFQLFRSILFTSRRSLSTSFACQINRRSQWRENLYRSLLSTNIPPMLINGNLHSLSFQATGFLIPFHIRLLRENLELVQQRKIFIHLLYELVELGPHYSAECCRDTCLLKCQSESATMPVECSFTHYCSHRMLSCVSIPLTMIRASDNPQPSFSRINLIVPILPPLLLAR